MRSPLKEKIQNAINRAIHDNHSDYISTGDGALIVGGRRRNRKKKKKQNGQKKKKTHSLENIKTRLSPKGCRKGDTPQEIAPLITDTEENKDDIKDASDHNNISTFEEFDTPEEHVEDVIEKTKNGQYSGQDTEDGEGQDETADLQKQEVEDEVVVSEVVHVTHLEPSVNINRADDDVRSPAVHFANDVQDVNESQPSLLPSQTEETTGTKTEDSPLIDKDKETSDSKRKKGKDSKFKDQQPGVLCCTIL